MGEHMRIILERWIVFGVVFLSFLCAWRASAAPKVSIAIHKVFNHRETNPKAIELGSLVFYGEGFAKDPLKPNVTAIDDTQEYRFTIPRVAMSAAIHEQLEQINKQKRGGNAPHGYTLQIEGLNKPQEKLELVFKCPKNHCQVSCAYINSIQHEKGLVFKVYNRTQIEALKKQHNPVIRTALHTPPRIFIDPGHGGDDKGAVAASGVTEKKVCLAVSKKVKQKLCNLGYTVCMSRDTDVAAPLDARTHKACRFDADLVVSIHANAASKEASTGIEIFFLDPQLVEHERNISPHLYAFLKKYYEACTEDNKKLTSAIHTLCNQMLPQHNAVFKDRGIKTAISQVLLGAVRPATLIEIGFLSNPTEARLLADPYYQAILADAIARGIHHYFITI
jgi:N-acetylmuramoyl-L-alanine amidase